MFRIDRDPSNGRANIATAEIGLPDFLDAATDVRRTSGGRPCHEARKMFDAYLIDLLQNASPPGLDGP
jgi:hypothetical protein